MLWTKYETIFCLETICIILTIILFYGSNETYHHNIKIFPYMCTHRHENRHFSIANKLYVELTADFSRFDIGFWFGNTYIIIRYSGVKYCTQKIVGQDYGTECILYWGNENNKTTPPFYEKTYDYGVMVIAHIGL